VTRMASGELSGGGSYDVYLVGSTRDRGPIADLAAAYIRDERSRRLENEFMTTQCDRPQASAAEILGNGKTRIEPRWQKHFERLIRMRDELNDQRGDSLRRGQEREEHFNRSLGDKGSDEYDRGAAFELVSSKQNALYEIEQALGRILDGRFGICEATGEMIPEERLESIPWTRFARDVEAELEKEEKE